MRSRNDNEEQHLPDQTDDIYERSNLTKRQLLLWIAQRLNPGVPIYNVIETFAITGEIKSAHFQKAFQALVDRSDALRTVIKETDGIPRQRVISHFPYCVDYLEFSDKSDPQQAFQRWLKQRSAIRFKLEDRLFDSALIKISGNQYVWYLNLHQIITDCWSTSLIYRCVADFYERSLKGQLAEIPALPSFQDYIKYERAYRCSDGAKKAEVYWQQKLAKSFKPTSFYGKAPREKTTHTQRMIQELGRERSQKLKAIATQKDVRFLTWDLSLFNVFATIVFTYLYRVSGNRRLAIGTPFQNRPTGIFKDTIGLFVEVCPLQIEIAQDDTFLSLLKKVMKKTQEVLVYAQYSIGNPEHNRLYDVMLNYANWAFPDFCGFPTQNRQVRDHSEDSLFIQVNDLERSHGFVLWFDFNRDIFDEVQCSRAIQHFLSVVDAFLSDKTQRISGVDLLSEQERECALVECNATETEKFMANPFSEDPQARLYETGDLARYLPNGAIECLGRLDHQEAYVAPRTPLEHLLAKMWQDVLGIERIGIYDNFFELGGDSLKAATFVTNLQQELGQMVYTVALSDAPNIADLTSYLQQHYPDATSRWFTRRSAQSTTARTTEKVKGRIGSREITQFRRLIPSQRAEQVEDTASKNPPAIFLLSPPRSGSTLFRAMLAGHPRLFAPPELELLSFNTLEDRKLALSGRYNFWLEGTVRAIMETKGCGAAAAKSIMEDCEARKLSTRQMYRLLQEWIGDRVLVDKTPSYALDQGILKRAETDFENPLYVHLLRNPCAVIHSFEQAKLNQVFFRYPHRFSVRQLAELIWLISQENILEFLEQIPLSRQIQIKFEDLVKEPRRIMEEFCQFLGLEYHADLLRPYDSKEKRMTDGIYPVSKMLGDPKFHHYRDIDPRVSDKWKDYYADDFLGDKTWELAERLGYERPEDTRVGRGPSQGTAVSVRWPAAGPRPLVVPLQRNGSKPPFFFLAGRSHFGDRLGPDQPVYRVVYQDLDREQPLVRVEDMAAYSIKGVRTIQPEGPYYLGGHGLGGTVAFEVAHQLQRQGEKVALLVLCESWAPGAKRPTPGTSSAYRLWQRASYYFDRVRRIGARQALADLLRGLKTKTQRAAWRRQGVARTRSPQGHRAAAFEAVRQYVPQTYSGRITVVRCNERVAWKHHDPLRGWGRLATDGLDAHETPGGHASIYREPNVGMLVRTLNDVLHKAQARAESERMALADPSVSAAPITSDDGGGSVSSRPDNRARRTNTERLAPKL